MKQIGMLLLGPLQLQQEGEPEGEEEQEEEKEEIVKLRGQSRCSQHHEQAQAGELKVVFGLFEVKELDSLDHDEELGKGDEKGGLEDEKQKQGVDKGEDDDTIEEQSPFPWLDEDADGMCRQGTQPQRRRNLLGEDDAEEPAQDQGVGNDEQQEVNRSEEHTSELQSRLHLVCRLLLEKRLIIELIAWILADMGEKAFERR